MVCSASQKIRLNLIKCTLECSTTKRGGERERETEKSVGIAKMLISMGYYAVYCIRVLHCCNDDDAFTFHLT